MSEEKKRAAVDVDALRLVAAQLREVHGRDGLAEEVEQVAAEIEGLRDADRKAGDLIGKYATENATLRVRVEEQQREIERCYELRDGDAARVAELAEWRSSCAEAMDLIGLKEDHRLLPSAIKKLMEHMAELEAELENSEAAATNIQDQLEAARAEAEELRELRVADREYHEGSRRRLAGAADQAKALLGGARKAGAWAKVDDAREILDAALAAARGDIRDEDAESAAWAKENKTIAEALEEVSSYTPPVPAQHNADAFCAGAASVTAFARHKLQALAAARGEEKHAPDCALSQSSVGPDQWCTCEAAPAEAGEEK
jgi:hypothetical protein